MNTIELSINNFKAINKADIVLDGITVLSGVNGSGKSSLSKLLYYTFKYANAFEQIPSKEYSELTSISHAVNSLRYEPEIRKHLNDKGIRFENMMYPDSSFTELGNYVLGSLKQIKDIVDQIIHQFNGSNRLNEDRMRRIIRDALNRPKDNKSLSELLEELLIRTEKLANAFSKRNEDRPYKDLKSYLEIMLLSPLKDIVIKEYGVPLIGKGVFSVPLPHFIQNVVYIDTPMIIGNVFPVNGSGVEYWHDLFEMLSKPKQRNYSKKIFHILRDDIMHGEASKDNNYLYFPYRYNRDDGQAFMLFESATGIKSFSVLQMLLRNGVINKNTLLIIDEPEAHLHPQWIVEYARVVVQIHKLIGTKFFIASHSTDFVSAIRYIAEKNKQLSSLRFYLGEESKDKKYMFEYRDLGIDIEPVFASFNKSYDKLSEYGV